MLHDKKTNKGKRFADCLLKRLSECVYLRVCVFVGLFTTSTERHPEFKPMTIAGLQK